jgi:hypothetical protein
VREDLADGGIVAVIPPTSNRRVPADLDRDSNKSLHLIENSFQELREYRGIAVRCCKTDTSEVAFIAVTATLIP